MRRLLLTGLLSAVALLFLSASPVLAQGAVYNGDFETGTLAPGWTLVGGNTYTQLVLFETKPGNKSYGLKRRPGPPSNNGGIEQTIHLVGGVTYVFEADIVSQYCAS